MIHDHCELIYIYQQLGMYQGFQKPYDTPYRVMESQERIVSLAVALTRVDRKVMKRHCEEKIPPLILAH